MSCSKCNSIRIAYINSKCSDCFSAQITIDKDHDIDYDGYVPDDMGIGGGDNVKFSYCLDCGQIQGKWPKPMTELEFQRIENEDCDGSEMDTGDEC